MQSTVQELSEQVEILQRQVTANTSSMDRIADAIQSLQQALVGNSDAGGVQRPVPMHTQPSENAMHGKSFVGGLQDGPLASIDASDPGTPPLERDMEEIGRGVERDSSVEERVAAREARRRADEQHALILHEAAVSGVREN